MYCYKQNIVLLQCKCFIISNAKTQFNLKNEKYEIHL